MNVPAGTTQECALRGCPGEVDKDGYCRVYGHLCQGDGAPAPVAVGAVLGAATSNSTSTSTPISTSGRRAGSRTGAAPAGPATESRAAARAAGPAIPSARSSRRLPVTRPTRPTSMLVSTPALSRAEALADRWSGLVDMPAQPLADPESAVLADPAVSESRRFCSRCHQPVGRSANGRPGRTEGFCPRDRAPYSFTPKLSRGDRVNQFEVVGCLAHGGVGWIYLARDRNLDGSWRVLKGLRDAGDADAWEAVVAERGFLAQVDHPNIVKVYDFVQHPDPVTSTVAGYIVMEYVGGRSLQQLLADRRAVDGAPLPLPEVLAYGLDILAALGYLHGRGLLYCDMKPDNVIAGPDRLKLIDLGAVRRLDDTAGSVWGSSGYQAPEVVDSGPSVRSDLYSVGRTLAVLSLGTRVLSTEGLPDPEQAPLLAREESFHRLLRRATNPDPRQRFASAQQLREQMHGVLREVLSAADGKGRPAASALFGPQPRSFGTDEAGEMLTQLDPVAVATALSVPLVNITDEAASFLGTLGYPHPDEVIAALAASGVSTVEVTLRLVRAYIDLSDPASAREHLDRLLPEHERDWRVAWYRGVVALAAADPEQALEAFDAVYAQLPGDFDAKLACAAAAEMAGDAETAAALYERIWFTHRDYVSAAFGTARLRLAAGDWNGAVDVLESVPHSSSHYLAAQVAAVRARLQGPNPADLRPEDLVQAGERIRALKLDQHREIRARIEVLHGALRWAEAGGNEPGEEVLGCRLTEREVRFGLDREYRALAQLMPRGSAERIRLVDRANAVRPRTLW